MSYNVSFISLGCAKNQVNCEQMMALCAEAGYSIQAQPEGCDVVVGMGGGKALDTAKAVAENLGLPCVIIPTVASNDAPCSGVAVLYNDAGVVIKAVLMRRNPDLVLVDTGIIANAPRRLFAAGLGDALSTWFEARACKNSGARTMARGNVSNTGLMMARLCYDLLMEKGRDALAAVERHEVTPALEDVVEATIYLSGLGFENGGLAAAHAVNDGFAQEPQAHGMYHGEKVAFGTLVQLVLEKAPQEELEQVLFRDVLGEAKTHVSGSAGRIGNVKLSAQIINGLVLNSGETFSYNGSVGKRTADRGFKPAPAYVKGETVDEIGGGICQTSSTLYLACLLSNLEITERYAHRYVPAYIAWGMDATVSWGGPDYKFTNNTLYPVKIVTKYEKGYLTVQILGTNVDGTYVKMSNEVLSKTPWETIYQEDPTMAPGSPDVVKVTPYTGYKVNSYQTIYDKDGKVIDSHFEASSNYKVRNKVILQAPAAQPGSGTAEIPAVTPNTPSDTPVPMEPTVPAEPAASPGLPVEPEIPAEP